MDHRFLRRIEALKRELASIERDYAAIAGTAVAAPYAPAEPATLPVPDESTILLAMYDAGACDRPVSATAIADELWHGEQGHGDVIRVGHRLGMMSSVGLVRRIPGGDCHLANRWELPKGGEDARARAIAA